MQLDKPEDNQGEAGRILRPRSPRVSLDELVAKSHTVFDRMEALVRRIAGRFRR